MSRTIKKIMAAVITAAMIISGVMIPDAASAAKKICLNKKKATIKVGGKLKLKLKNSKKKVKWSSSKKKIATVTQKGVVKGKKKGSVKITAKSGGKKYICRVTVKARSSSPAQTGSSPAPGSTAEPGTSLKPGATAKPGASSAPDVQPGDEGNTDGTGGSSTLVDDMPSSPANTLTVGKMQVTLGMTESELVSKLGQARVEKVPQDGFKAYVYNPGADYQNYLIVYLDGDTVAGMSTISKYFSYESLVYSGDSVSTLTSRSFTSLGYGYTAAYRCATTSANVLAYTDKQGDGNVYGVQIFSDQYKLDDMLRPQNCTYTTETAGAVKKQMPELVNAFRRYKGISIMCTVRGTTAQEHSDKMINAGVAGTVSSKDPDGTSLPDRIYAYCNSSDVGYGENNGNGSADAFGYISYWIDDTTANLASGSSYTAPYFNLILTEDEYGSISPYYINAGLSYDTTKSAYVTYGVLDFFYS